MGSNAARRSFSSLQISAQNSLAKIISCSCSVYRNRLALAGHNLASDQTVSSVHGNGTDCVFSHMVRDLQNESNIMVLYFQRSRDERQLSFELNINNSTDDLQSSKQSLLLPTHLMTTMGPLYIIALFFINRIRSVRQIGTGPV